MEKNLQISMPNNVQSQRMKCKEDGKNLKKKKWGENEDTQLSDYIKIFGTKWLKVAENMNGRSANQCSQRWKRIKKLQPNDFGIIKKRWTLVEDRKLIELYKQYGPDWKMISEQIPNKNRRAVRNRYINTLDSNINHEQMTEEEDILICQLYQQHGGQWSLISKSLQGRPENMIKNRFYSQLKQKYFQQQNLYYIKNSKKLQKERKEQILSFQNQKILQKNNVEIEDSFNWYNQQFIHNEQESSMLEIQESNFNFLRIFR